MANAKICDRCGKVYPVPERRPELVVARAPVERWNSEDFADLCETCTDDLYKFMNIEKPDRRVGY